MEEELAKWGESTSKYFQQTAHDVKEIMLIVAETTQALGDRDHRFAREFHDFAGQLAAIGNLGDLTKIRQSSGEKRQSTQVLRRKNDAGRREIHLPDPRRVVRLSDPAR